MSRITYGCDYCPATITEVEHEEGGLCESCRENPPGITTFSIDDLFNELHRRLVAESEVFVACNRPTSSMMVAVCDQIDEAHHVYTDLTTDPVEAQS